MSDTAKKIAETAVDSLMDPMAQAMVRVLDRQGLAIVSKDDAELIGPAKMLNEELQSGWRAELAEDQPNE